MQIIVGITLGQMQTIPQRLSLFIESTGMSKNKFAAHIGTSSALISKLTTEDVDFRKEILEKIIAKYPLLNIYWLLTGVGEMLLKEENLRISVEEKKDLVIQTLRDQGLTNEEVTKALQEVDVSMLIREIDVNSFTTVSQMQRKGAMTFIYDFRQSLKKHHPEVDTFLEDYHKIEEVQRLIAEISSSKIGTAVWHGLTNLKDFSSLKDYKEKNLELLKACLPYSSAIHEFAEASSKFIGDMKAIKDEIDLKFEFDDEME